MEHVKWNVNDTCYWISHGSTVEVGTVVAVDETFCTVKYSRNGAIRLRKSKLFQSQEAAQEALSNFQSKAGVNNYKPYRSPYDYL